MAKLWEKQAGAFRATKVYEKRLGEIWRETGCDAEGAPYVVRELLSRLTGKFSPFALQSPHLPVLATAFLDEEHCPGAHGLSDADKAKLKAIRDRAPLPAPQK
jgi:hypothetical protein